MVQKKIYGEKGVESAERLDQPRILYGAKIFRRIESQTKPKPK